MSLPGRNQSLQELPDCHFIFQFRIVCVTRGPIEMYKISANKGNIKSLTFSCLQIVNDIKSVFS